MATYTGADKSVGFLFEIAKNIAEDYDDSTTYAVGAYCLHQGTLYKCTTAVSSPETFDPTKWSSVLVMDEVAAGGGGGGGTTVIANPPGVATDTLNKLQVGSTIYDVPSGGGGGGHTYSTVEHIIGTWIDGRSVYEITINCGHAYTGPSSGTLGSFYAVTYDIQSLGAEQVLSIEGFDESGMNFPFFNPLNTQYAVFLYANKNSINVRLGIGFARTNDVYATIRYIKPAT